MKLEVELFLDLYPKCLSTGKKKAVNLSLMAERWNAFIVNHMVQSENLSSILEKYCFKTTRHLQAFKAYLEKKLLA